MEQEALVCPTGYFEELPIDFLGDKMGVVSMDPRDMGVGAVLQCLEAVTLGMPFEVWKTRMGRFRQETTVGSFRTIYQTSGARGFWQGTSAKMVESASKGAILLFSKEAINTSLLTQQMNPVYAGLLAGAGGGVCQTLVMAPCTFIVTAKVTGASSLGTSQILWTQGRQIYRGASAIAFRQATNWASRQGLTEFFRAQLLKNQDTKLSAGQEILCGSLGGALSCWNHPFEVLRIEMQASASEKPLGLMGTCKKVYQADGLSGFYRGIVPRMFLGVWQTLFMVTAAKSIKEALA